MTSSSLFVAAAVAGPGRQPALRGHVRCRLRGVTGKRAGHALAFQAGRLIGYAALGALVAASAGALQWAAAHAALLKPLWGMFHVAVLCSARA